jgi:hypothetical protein
MHGMVPHSKDYTPGSECEPTGIVHYGPTPSSCNIIDGFFMAMRPRRIKEADLQFDTRFTFHHYDIDFCP